jgi:DNA-binding response OmpR family regulator
VCSLWIRRSLANADRKRRRRFLLVVEGYLDKPFAPQLLLERVRAALDRRAGRSVAA